MNQLLLWLVCLPLVGAFLCVWLPDRSAKAVALLFSLVGTLLSLLLWQNFDASTAETMQLMVTFPWIKAFQIQFALGVDGLSFPMVVLTKFMVPIALLTSFGVEKRANALMAAFLVLDSAMTGTFLATDIFLFYVFWEVMLLPMILIIGVWGSTERIYAALKFFLYTFAGSLLMLVAIFWIYYAHLGQSGGATANIASFYGMSFSAVPVIWGLTSQDLIFLAFAIAFAIKVPLFPLHTWLPDAHVQAPTGGSVILAAVLLKMGAYGLLRFAIPICPQSFAKFTNLIVILSLSGILYGAWVALQQTDFKKLVAYSSVSHLGFVTLGICTGNTEGLTGAMMQMVNHGLSTGALFLLVGALYERRHSRNFADFGGLAETMPWFAVFLVFVSASSMAVPGLNGFIGEFLVLSGTFKANPYWAAVAVTGVVFGAAYMLIMLRKVLFGESQSAENRMLKDLSFRDYASLVPLALLIILLGVKPQFFLKKFDRSLQSYWHQGVKSTAEAKEVSPGEEKS